MCTGSTHKPQKIWPKTLTFFLRLWSFGSLCVCVEVNIVFNSLYDATATKQVGRTGRANSRVLCVKCGWGWVGTRVCVYVCLMSLAKVVCPVCSVSNDSLRVADHIQALMEDWHFSMEEFFSLQFYKYFQPSSMEQPILCLFVQS